MKIEMIYSPEIERKLKNSCANFNYLWTTIRLYIENA